MSDEPTPTQPGEDRSASAEERTGAPTAKRLLRARDDRMIAGVAAGLGRYFGIDPTIVRIGFAVSVFFGGVGAFAYLALALLVPSGDATGTEIERAPIERSRALAIAAGIGIFLIAASWGFFDGGWLFDGGPWFFGPPLVLIALGVGLYLLLRNTGNSSLASVVGRVVLALFVLAAAGMAATVSAWAGATGHGVLVALIVIAIGVMLILSAFSGGARWLVAPAAVLAIPLALVAAADVSFGDGIGQREYRPVSVAEIPDDGYELGVGRLAVDLRALEWEPGETVAVRTDLGVGETVVAVPESVCVSADAEVRIGAVNVAGTRSDGFDAEVARSHTPQGAPHLVLEADADLGAIRVLNDDDVDVDDHDHDWDRFDDEEDEEELEDRMDAACAARPAPEQGGEDDARPGSNRAAGGRRGRR